MKQLSSLTLLQFNSVLENCRPSAIRGKFSSVPTKEGFDLSKIFEGDKYSIKLSELLNTLPKKSLRELHVVMSWGRGDRISGHDNEVNNKEPIEAVLLEAEFGNLRKFLEDGLTNFKLAK